MFSKIKISDQILLLMITMYSDIYIRKQAISEYVKVKLAVSGHEIRGDLQHF